MEEEQGECPMTKVVEEVAAEAVDGS